MQKTQLALCNKMIALKFIMILVASGVFGQKQSRIEWQEIDGKKYYATAYGAFTRSWEEAQRLCAELHPEAYLATFNSKESTVQAVFDLVANALRTAGISQSSK